MVFGEVITKQIEAMHACEKSEERFRVTFENAAVGIAHIAPDLQWIRVNDALSRIIGWPADDIVTMSLRDVCHPDDFAEDLRRTEQIRQGKIDSYVMDKRYLRKDGSITWARVTVSGVRKSGGALDYFVRVIEDISAQKRAEELLQLLLREARHRTKNILSLVDAIARQTAAGDPQDFIGRFTERIQALAANQDLLVRHEWQRIDVKDLVQVQLGHFADLIGTRINFDGPKLHLNAAAAQAIGLALHELATNAGKYGALSTDAGCVDVSWQRDNDTFVMSWIERNGPPARPPERRGFGSIVTESMVKQALGGEVQLDYAPSGLEWHLTCHAAGALEGGG
jgi:PAS domain S-box-containing protein